MAKRFTDTGKWKKEFIKGLSAKHKLLWFYILDDCDHAGVWEVDLEVASLRIGERLDYDEAFVALGSQFEVIGKYRWWIRDFITFQYGNLTPRNKMYAPVMAVLTKYNIQYNMGHISPIDGVKVKDKVKDKVEVKDTGGAGGIQTSDFSYEFKPSRDETLHDFEVWTEAVIEGNDVLFLNMVRGHNIQLNGQLERLARDHLGKAARYEWHKKTTTQQAFRHSLINYITENINKQPNGTSTKGTFGSASSNQVSGTNYNGSARERTSGVDF